MAGRKSLNSDPPSVFTPFLRRFTDEIARDVSDTRALYRRVRNLHQASPFGQPAIVDRIHGILAQDIRNTVTVPSYIPLAEALDHAINALLVQEATVFALPEIE